MKNFTKIMTFVILAAGSLAFSMQKPTITATIVKPLATNQLPAELASKPFVHVKSLIEKSPNEFDGLTDIFSALAIERAAADAFNNPRLSFEQALATRLADREQFGIVRDALNNLIQSRPADAQVFYGSDASGIYDALSPNPNNLYSLEVKNNALGNSYIIDPRVSVGGVEYYIGEPETVTADRIDKAKEKVTLENVQNLLTNIRNKSLQAAHFVYFDGHQHMLFSVVTDTNKKAKIYLITPLATAFTPGMNKFINLLLEKTTALNQ